MSRGKALVDLCRSDSEVLAEDQKVPLRSRCGLSYVNLTTCFSPLSCVRIRVKYGSSRAPSLSAAIRTKYFAPPDNLARLAGSPTVIRVASIKGLWLLISLWGHGVPGGDGA